MKPCTLALLFTLPLAACTDETTDPAAAEFRGSGGGPGCIGCVGNNSPHLNDSRFPELSLDGLANDAGAVLDGIMSPGNDLYALDVVDDDFVARGGGGTIVAAAGALVGWKLVLSLPGDVQELVQIEAFDGDISSWAAGAPAMSGYALSYQDSDTQEWRNVCPMSGADHDDIAVTLIAGETYDRELKRTNPGMTGWVTIACRDEAVYKMKRMNYGPNDVFGATGEPATVAQRDATLKMITADYCGTGHSYTVQGTQVYWKNAAELVDNYPGGGGPSLEARWTEDGATCLSDTRYVDPEVVACDLPACPAHQQGAYEWSTWVP